MECSVLCFTRVYHVGVYCTMLHYSVSWWSVLYYVRLEFIQVECSVLSYTRVCQVGVYCTMLHLSVSWWSVLYYVTVVYEGGV